MFKNYFYLRRAVVELLPVLQNNTIIECYSQEKDKLYFYIPTQDCPNRHLIISTNSSLPFLYISETHHKAKKNTVSFFNEYLPAKINNIQIADNDRVVRISFDNFKIYFFLHGNKSNILLIDDNNKIVNFKNTNDSELKIRVELEYLNFNSGYTLNNYESDDLKLDYQKLKNTFPFLDKVFFQEISGRLEVRTDPELIIEQMISAINRILTDDINVFYDEFTGKTYFIPHTFLFSRTSSNNIITNNYNAAINALFTTKFKNEKIKNLRNQIGKFLDKEINRTAYKLNSLSTRLKKGSREKEYYKKGNILLSNLKLIGKGFDEIELSDYEDNSTLIIKLDNKLPPNKNVDKYFEKAKDEKINFKKSSELFGKTENKYKSLLNLKSQFDNASSVQELESLIELLKLKKNDKTKKKMSDNLKFRHYIIEDKYHVYVGKDSKSNDILSTKFAKQNDYWFHARGLPGSHVVLRVENTKEGIPKNIIKDAASIAGFFSKAKTAKAAPISYTLGKFVYKKKGMEPGKVMISKEKVLIVKPGIPKNTEIVNDS